MQQKVLWGLVLALGTIAALVWPVQAGGWAVVTLDAVPTALQAQTPRAIGFMVRQHGLHPREGLAPVVVARQRDGTGELRVDAHAEGQPGHYAATLIFPSAGQWAWEIEAFGSPQVMPPLLVAAPVVDDGAQGEGGAAPSSLLTLVVRGAALVGGLGGVALALRRRQPEWLVSAMLVLVLVVVTAAPAIGTRSTSQPANPAPLAPSGEALFVAKGCPVCHQHDGVTPAPTLLIGTGPDLTHYRGDPGWLRRWLQNPAAIKPQTQMPTLGLSEAELDTLSAWLGDRPAGALP